MSTTTGPRTIAERLGVILCTFHDTIRHSTMSAATYETADAATMDLYRLLVSHQTAVGFCSDCGEPIQPEQAGRANWSDECNDYSCWTWRCPTCGEPGSTSVN